MLKVFYSRADSSPAADLRRRKPEMNASLGPYSATCARDGAMNQATTRTAKARNATAIISWLLRLNQWDVRSRALTGSLDKESAQISSA